MPASYFYPLDRRALQLPLTAQPTRYVNLATDDGGWLVSKRGLVLSKPSHAVRYGGGGVCPSWPMTRRHMTT